jgi:hypothetical protein
MELTDEQKIELSRLMSDIKGDLELVSLTGNKCQAYQNPQTLII